MVKVKNVWYYLSFDTSINCYEGIPNVQSSHEIAKICQKDNERKSIKITLSQFCIWENGLAAWWTDGLKTQILTFLIQVIKHRKNLPGLESLGEDKTLYRAPSLNPVT